MLCYVAENIEDEKLYEFDFTKDQTETDVLTEVSLETTPPLTTGLTYTKFDPAKAICTPQSTDFYTIQLTQGHYLFTCNTDTGLQVHKLDCSLLRKIYEEKDGNLVFGPHSDVTIKTTATVAHVGISFCFSFLLTAFLTNSSISKRH